MRRRKKASQSDEEEDEQEQPLSSGSESEDELSEDEEYTSEEEEPQPKEQVSKKAIEKKQSNTKSESPRYKEKAKPDPEKAPSSTRSNANDERKYSKSQSRPSKEGDQEDTLYIQEKFGNVDLNDDKKQRGEPSKRGQSRGRGGRTRGQRERNPNREQRKHYQGEPQQNTKESRGTGASRQNPKKLTYKVKQRDQDGQNATQEAKPVASQKRYSSQRETIVQSTDNSQVNQRSKPLTADNVQEFKPKGSYMVPGAGGVPVVPYQYPYGQYPAYISPSTVYPYASYGGYVAPVVDPVTGMQYYPMYSVESSRRYNPNKSEQLAESEQSAKPLEPTSTQPVPRASRALQIIDPESGAVVSVKQDTSTATQTETQASTKG